MWVIETLSLTVGGPSWVPVELWPSVTKNAFWEIENAIRTYQLLKSDNSNYFHSQSVRIRNAVTQEVIPVEIL